MLPNLIFLAEEGTSETSNNPTSVSISLLSTTFQQGHFTVPITLRPLGCNEMEVTVMIDSGATSNFINSCFIEAHRIPTDEKEMPIALSVIDGMLISSGAVTYHTAPCRLQIGTHHDKIRLDVTSLGVYDIILGLL